MVRRFKETLFIDRDPNDPFQGWGWVDIDQEVAKRLESREWFKAEAELRNYLGI